MKVGDFVKGLPNNGYSVANEDMTKGVVTKVVEDAVEVKIINHKKNFIGVFNVCADKFEVIGHVKKFNRAEVLDLLKNGCKKVILDYDLRGADLGGADLRDADLRGADLRGADLRGADIDFSCYPLWCGSLGLKADKRLACQFAYHLCSMQCDDAEFVKMRNSILGFANQFHRAYECGVLEPIEEEVA